MNHSNFDAKSKPFTDSRSSSSSTSSGFSLFRWFRRNERVRSKITPIAEPTDNPQRFNSSETLSPPDSPNLSRGYRSQSSSCDSILSTETTGFAFVPATSYHPIGGLENQLPKASGSDLDTFRRRILEQKRNRQVELNLTKKYGLFATDTLKSVKEDAERVDYSDLSLPTPDIPSRSHRRTHSESSSRGRVKVHVKGKRKAPQPPKFTENLGRKSLLENTTVSPASTLGRKKRRAPQPPEVAENAPKSILEGGLLDDKEIQAILGGESPTTTESMDRIRMPVADEVGEDVIANDTLKLEKGVLKAIKPIEVKEEAKVVTPSSPISPRPWYKRPLSGNRDTSIPFKKEVILRTVDKRRHRETKEKDNDALPEVNYSRNSSLFDSAKFGLFSRHPTREETKRRSGIGIPNISELDREAAEIVQQEKSRGLSPPQALILRPQMFGSPQSSLDDEDEDGPRKSTKELISKFEASSNGARITLNTSFIGRTDNFVDSRTRVSANEETINKVDGLVNSPMAQKRSIFSDTQSPPNSPIKTHPNDNLKVHGDEKDDKENLKSIGIWTCPYCTLENPNWRILCEVCERIKPYDKRLVNLMEPERKVPTSQQIRQPLAPKPSSPKENWERKAEIVKRYFNPGQGLNSLAKSASETSIGKPPQKRNSPSKLIGSPKFGFRGFMQRSSPEKAKGINKEDSDLEMESSVVSKGRDGTPDLEELRLARLNRFRMEKAVNPLTDRDSLEKEKKRLREMIRAMNAKALAEKYPVIQKAASLDEASSPSKGAIKKTYPNTKLVIEETKKEPDKSTKVSSSAQTGAILKKTPSPEIEEQPQEKPIQATEPIYANLNCQVNHVKFSEVEKAKVDELTEQLKSVKGREEFKATLKFSELSGNTDTLAINKIMKSLELAIVEGQHELAATLAKDLAKMKVSLSVTRQKTRPLSITDIDMKPFMIDLYVEDKVAHKGPLQMSVNSQMTLKELKDKVSKDFSIPIDVQRWILNDQLATDETKKLIDYSIRDSSAVIYLYLVSPPSRKPSHKDPMKYFLAEEDQFSICGSDEEIQNEKVLTDVGFAEDIGATALPIPKESSDTLEKGWPCPLCTLINSPTRLCCGVCSEARPLDYMVPPDYPKPEKAPEVQQEKVDNVILRPLERKNDLNRVNPNRKSAELFNIVQEEIRFKNAGLQTPSPNITKNKYRGVYNYNPSTKYSHQISSQTKKMAPQPPNLHRELLNLDNADIVANIEAFECPICFMKFQPGEGVILRDCLHTFCRECLGHTVEYSEDAQVKCPFMNAVYSCDSVLQDREIKALVTRDVYEKYLAKSVRQAEHKIENAFHCKTPNCRGWCIYEDNVNLFKCPVCRITNCLTCQVIHDGLNCKQYQDRMNSDCDSNVDARRTKEMLETMVDKGEAMKCPTCQVVLMKKWGCDWLKCSMCKTEICWVTRGPRWGPAGKGDTSAGCKCGVDSKKCHPKCNYCH